MSIEEAKQKPEEHRPLKNHAAVRVLDEELPQALLDAIVSPTRWDIPSLLGDAASAIRSLLIDKMGLEQVEEHITELAQELGVDPDGEDSISVLNSIRNRFDEVPPPPAEGQPDRRLWSNKAPMKAGRYWLAEDLFDPEPELVDVRENSDNDMFYRLPAGSEDLGLERLYFDPGQRGYGLWAPAPAAEAGS